MDKTRPPLYEVGEIIIDTRQRCLRQNGAEQHLRVQAFQTLTYLIEHRDRVVPKEELFHVIWKDAIVSEDTLVQCIGHVRRALGDDAQEPRHIKTIAKVGYRFVGPVAEVGDGDEAVPRLRTVDTPGTSSSAVHGRRRWNAAYGPMRVLVAFTLASGGVTTPHGSSASVEAGMSAAPTDNLEAFRSYSVAVDKANAYDTDGALRLLERAVSLDPGYAMAYARIGYIYASVRVNEGERAKPYLEKAFQLKDRLSEKERLFIDAWYASAQSDNDGEARALRRLIAAYPRETEGYWRLGYRLAYLDQIDEAIAVYERGLAVDPDAKEIWNALGFHYNAIGRYADAIAAHQRYVALDPREPNAHDSLGITYDQAGRYSDALASIDRALALNPRFHFAVVHKGDSYVQLGRYREALEQYRRYVELAPSDWDRAVGSHHMALVYWRQGDLLNADRAARQEHRFNHDFGTTLRLALARRDWSAAAHWERRYFGTPESPATGTVLEKRQPQYLRGAIALARGDHTKAEELFRSALKIPHLLWGINSVEDCLAQAYEHVGRLDDAVLEYERILRLNAYDALAHYRLARLLDRQGFQRRAMETYSRFLTLWKDADPDIAEVRDARERVREAAVAMRGSRDSRAGIVR